MRSGAASVAELVLVCAGFALVTAGVARFASGQRRVADAQRARVRWAEAVRTIDLVLGTDGRFLADVDIVGAGGDSARIRAFRGGGRVCASHGASLWLRYAGTRAVEPAKDSVLLLSRDTMAAFEVRSASPSDSCGSSLRLSLDPVPAEPAYGLVFETGAYMVSGRALRYRRGAGGRQPLTETLLDARSGLEVDPGSIRMTLVPDPASVRSGRIRPIRSRLMTLNRGIDGE